MEGTPPGTSDDVNPAIHRIQKNCSVEILFRTEYNSPPCASPAPAGGGGAGDSSVLPFIAGIPVILHYHALGDATAAGAEAHYAVTPKSVINFPSGFQQSKKNTVRFPPRGGSRQGIINPRAPPPNPPFPPNCRHRQAARSGGGFRSGWGRGCHPHDLR